VCDRTMLSYITGPLSWVKTKVQEHKKKLIGASLVSSGVAAYYAYTKLWPVVKDLRDKYNTFQELNNKMAEGDKDRVRRMLLEKLSDPMDLSRKMLPLLLKEVRKTIMTELDVAEVRKNLKKSKGQGRGDEEYKMWTEFKVTGLARTLSALYCVVLLRSVLAMQMTIIARFVMQDIQIEAQVQANLTAEKAEREQEEKKKEEAEKEELVLEEKKENGDDADSEKLAEIERDLRLLEQGALPEPVREAVSKCLLSSFQHVDGRGVRELTESVRAVVQTHFCDVNLQGKISFDDLAALLGETTLDAFSATHFASSSSNSSNVGDCSLCDVTLYSEKRLLADFFFPKWQELPSLVDENANLVANKFTLDLLPEQYRGEQHEGVLLAAARKRLIFMESELRHLLQCQSFASAAAGSVKQCFSVVAESWHLLLEPAMRKAHSSLSLPSPPSSARSEPVLAFVNLMIPFMKLFDSVLPGALAEDAKSSSSALYTKIIDTATRGSTLRDLCGVIYMPLRDTKYIIENADEHGELPAVADAGMGNFDFEGALKGLFESSDFLGGEGPAPSDLA
jgi:hypothetical protein